MISLLRTVLYDAISHLFLLILNVLGHLMCTSTVVILRTYDFKISMVKEFINSRPFSFLYTSNLSQFNLFLCGFTGPALSLYWLVFLFL